MIRRFLALIIIIAILLAAYPENSSATDAKDISISTISCVSGGLLAPKINEYVNIGVEWLQRKIPWLDVNNRFANTVPVNDKQFIGMVSDKETFRDVIARCTARQIFNAMSSGILDIARTGGRDGGSTYIKNWRTFEAQAGFRGEDVFRGMLSNAKLCNYIDKEIKDVFGVKQKTNVNNQNTRIGSLDPFSTRTSCTMPADFNAQAYQQNFAGNGGWEAFSRALQPQNNFYGILIQSLGELDTQRAAEISADTNQAIAGQGFTGKSGKNATDSCITKGLNGKCISYKDIKTPGVIIKENVAYTFQQELNWIANVHQLADIIETATNLMLRRLSDLSDPNEAEREIYKPPEVVTPTPIPDDGLACSVVDSGNGQYVDEVKKAVQDVKNDPAYRNLLDTVAIPGNNPDYPELNAYTQATLDQMVEAVLSKLRANIPDFLGGRIYNTCEPGGRIGTEAIIVGRQIDSLGEVYGLKDGGAEDRGATLREAMAASYENEKTSWDRLVPEAGAPTPPPKVPAPTPEPPRN